VVVFFFGPSQSVATVEKLYDYVCVCNRNAASVSIISTATDQIVTTIYLNFSTHGNIPMYCNYFERNGTRYISVGDRGFAILTSDPNNGTIVHNGSVHFYTVDKTITYVNSIVAAFGTYHHYVHVGIDQVWVVCDGALTLGVSFPTNFYDVSLWIFKLSTYEFLAKIPMPDDLKALAFNSPGTLHDVVLPPSGEYALVSTYFLPGVNDYILKYSTTTFEEIDRLAVGNLAHITYSPILDQLFVVSQNSLLYSIQYVDPVAFEITSFVSGSAGAHMMIGPAKDNHTFYVTNLPSGGIDGLFAYDTNTQNVNYAATTDTVYTTPHNLAFNHEKTKLYLTHSGTNVAVTVWDVSSLFSARPLYLRTITTGSNPYGIWNFQVPFSYNNSDVSSSAMRALPLLLSLFSFLALVLFV